MAKTFLSTVNTILPPQSPCPLSSTIAPAISLNPHTDNVNRCNTLAIAQTKATPSHLTKRSLTLNLTTLLALSFAGNGFSDAIAATLEEGVDKAYLQELVYKLGRVGQAIQDNRLSLASSILGPTTNVDWVKNVNKAFTKLSSSAEEKTEVDTFNSSLNSLVASVGRRDIRSAKIEFVTSVVALEKWTNLAGLVGQLTGL